MDADSMLEELDRVAEATEKWQGEFRATFEKYCERAKAIFPALVTPVLRFNTHGKAAGWAFYRENEIRLNPVYCQTQRADMLRNTLPHEIAHILAWQAYQDHGHGHAWAAMFGALTWRAPTRCHDYEHIATAKRRLYG